MTALYTIAPLVLAPDDRRFIDDFRARHDPHARVVEPHFTLAFACAALDEASYLAHVRAASAGAGPIAFSCRYAMLGADPGNADGYVYLVPDEGHAALSRLHDALHTGPLAPHLRLDLPFTPHVTIGRTRERAQAKRLCDELNAGALRIDGRVEALHVGTVADGRFATLGRVALAA
jgi:2'-5' RNA ligase